MVIGEGENGEPLNIGRKTRTVPTAIKRALIARDKSCAFPGCHHTRFVDAHHIERDFQNHWFFKRPDGRAVPACGYRANDMIDNDIGVVSRLLNNPPAGGLLSGTDLDPARRDLGPARRDNFMSEPPPPVYWH